MNLALTPDIQRHIGDLSTRKFTRMLKLKLACSHAHVMQRPLKRIPENREREHAQLHVQTFPNTHNCAGDQGGCEMLMKGLQTQMREAKVLEVRIVCTF